jgi:hypothetical protein
MAPTKASRAGSTTAAADRAASTSPPWACWTAPRVATIDSRASSRVGAGSPSTASPSLVAYAEAITEPRMATPRAPPTWRTELLTAAPAPAFSRGTTDMIASVAGASTRPIPQPCTARSASTSHSGADWSSSWMPAKETATSRNPDATTSFGPQRAASRELCGAMTAIPTATGMSAAPLCSGE